MAIALNDRELEIMRGLPYMLICLYTMAIRPRMDFKTGIVGKSPRISYQALGEWLYVEPAAGRVESGSPHKSAIRRAIAQLQKVGLIRSVGNDEQLVFKLPFANTDFSAQKKPDTNPTHHPDTVEALRGVAFEQQADMGVMAEPDTHPISGFISHKPPQLDTVASRESAPVVVVDDLIFPTSIKPAMQQEVVKLLTAMQIPRQAWQTILDEYTGAKAVRDIASPVGFIRKLAQTWQQGTFTVERGSAIADARERRAVEQAKRVQEVAKPALQKNSPVVLAELAKISALKKRAGVANV